MRRLVVGLFLILCTAPALAQNVVSQHLFSVGEEGRNATFMHLLQEYGEKCDVVIRTLFNGSIIDVDNWEALCGDRNSYSFGIPADQDAPVTLVSCRRLLAASAMMLKLAKIKEQPSGCQITQRTPQRSSAIQFPSKKKGSRRSLLELSPRGW